MPNPLPRRRIIIGALVALFALLLVWRALNPYSESGIVGIPHGNHVHYVPEDRDPDVPLGNFPTTKPSPDERILPDGRVVPR